MANVIKHKRGSGSDPGASDLVVGEVAIRTDTGKLFTKMDNGSVAEIAGGGSDIAINTLSSSSGAGGGSATFNGSAYRFTLSQPPSVSAYQLLVSINGVIQKPVSGTGQPSEGFAVDGTDIILGDAPETGADFFILTFKSLGVSEPADNSVTSAKIVDGAIVNADVNASAAIAGTKISPDFGSQNIVTTGDLTVDTTTLKVDASNNRVGIGTASPVKKLHIADAGDVGIALQTTNANTNKEMWEITCGGNASNEADLVFQSRTDAGSGGIEAMRLSSSGRVGIGTSSPEDLLHIKSGKLRIENTIVSNNDSTISYDNADFIIDVDPNNVRGSSLFQVNVDTVAGLTIDDNRRVGIGTTSPAYILDVVGDSGGSFSASTNSAQGQISIVGKNSGGSVSAISRIKSHPDGSSNQSHMAFETRNSSATMVEAMRITSDQKVGIGTTSPVNPLHVVLNGTDVATFESTTSGSAGSQVSFKHTSASPADNDIIANLTFDGRDDSNAATTYAQLRVLATDVSNNSESGAFQFFTRNAGDFTERLKITSDGNITFSMSASSGYPTQKIKWSNDSTTTNGFYISQHSDRNGRIWHEQGLSLVFGTADTERMRIDHDGGLFLGVTSAVNSSSGGICFRHNDAGRKELLMGTTTTATRALVEFINGNGSVGSISVSGSSTAYNTSSDYRLKENVTAISDGITRLKTLKPSRFNFKTDKDTTVDGFLAHEVTAVPEAITGTKDEVATEDSVSHKKGDPIYQSIDQSKLVPLLVAALQEAIGRIEALEAK